MTNYSLYALEYLPLCSNITMGATAQTALTRLLCCLCLVSQMARAASASCSRSGTRRRSRGRCELASSDRAANHDPRSEPALLAPKLAQGLACTGRASAAHQEAKPTSVRVMLVSHSGGMRSKDMTAPGGQ